MFVLFIGVVFVGEKKWHKTEPVVALELEEKAEKSLGADTVRLDHPSLHAKKYVKKKRTDFIRFRTVEDEWTDDEEHIEEELDGQVVEQQIDEQQPTNIVPNEREQVPLVSESGQNDPHEQSNNGERDANNVEIEHADEEHDHSRDQVNKGTETTPDRTTPDNDDERGEQSDGSMQQ